MPLISKQKIYDSEKDVEEKYVLQDYHLIKNTRVIVLDKLTAKEIYSVLLLSSGNNTNLPKIFGHIFCKWKLGLEENSYITKSSHYK